MPNSRNLRAQRATSDHLIISSLKATQLVESKSILPAELISAILDLLPISDLMSFAQTSKRMMEMVYEDSRWVQRLKAIGVWNEGEARMRAEELKTPNLEVINNGSVNYRGITCNTLCDAEIEAKQWGITSSKYTRNNSFHTLQALTKPNYPSEFSSLVIDINSNPEVPLNILHHVKSIRGFARLEFAKIYAALAPYYHELTRSQGCNELVIYKTYSNSEKLAHILSQILRFSKCDWALGWKRREEKLNIAIHEFESAQRCEFEHGYVALDIDGRMRRCAHALSILNGGKSAIKYFVENHSMFKNQKNSHNIPMNCLNYESNEITSFEPFVDFLKNAARILNEQSEIIDRVFPQGIDILQIFLTKFVEELFAPNVIPLMNSLYERNTILYVKSVPKLFEQSLRFGLSLRPSNISSQNFSENVKNTLAEIFVPQLDLYLQEDLDYFKRTLELEISEWESKLNDHDATTESFFLASLNRISDKKDFMTSFKKVVKMPIYVIPSVSKFGTKRSSNRDSLSIPISPAPTRSQSPGFYRSASPLTPPVSQINTSPNEELIAKTALMASRLEGIRSLISIEVALKFTHAAKESIERTALFVTLSGQGGEKARKQCSIIYVHLIQILGQRHVKSGFDKAVDHLSKYNPREVVGHQQAVAPLVNFLELVNVGDLVSQMIDVFYEQQLCANKLSNPNDSFDPAVQAKKSFEKMLDECVAAGLNKGIDVLIDEVEYLFATVQLPSDYNPGSISESNFELGPSKAAELIVNLVESHTKILEGGIDKNVLDVFNQEVGLRLFSVLCRHLKRQRVSINGAMKLISDINHYFLFIKTLRNNELLEYFKALKALSQIFLIAPTHAKEIAEVIADKRRFGGLFSAEELYEFVERRADWYSVKKDVEKAMYGIGCKIM
ncbi:F-box protein pof6 [Erysiphe neolycopersici]|uniref:F-box protein pof6 n=1 Tax=Erysiphe neolycopersici TaxID=212602 RepID=A0A420HBJ2_9PEZI|nr:F-box protein pof6 [Erysiphe neolycopersici]